MVVLLEVETDQGVVGIAEAAAHFPPASVLGFLSSVKALFIGQSPLDMAQLFARARTLAGVAPTPRAGNIALAGLEYVFRPAGIVGNDVENDSFDHELNKGESENAPSTATPAAFVAAHV